MVNCLSKVPLPIGPIVLTGAAAYFLVTAHVDGVESPAGFASGGAEIDRSRSTCR